MKIRNNLLEIIGFVVLLCSLAAFVLVAISTSGDDFDPNNLKSMMEALVGVVVGAVIVLLEETRSIFKANRENKIREEELLRKIQDISSNREKGKEY